MLTAIPAAQCDAAHIVVTFDSSCGGARVQSTCATKPFQLIDAGLQFVDVFLKMYGNEWQVLLPLLQDSQLADALGEKRHFLLIFGKTHGLDLQGEGERRVLFLEYRRCYKVARRYKRQFAP